MVHFLYLVPGTHLLLMSSYTTLTLLLTTYPSNVGAVRVWALKLFSISGTSFIMYVLRDYDFNYALYPENSNPDIFPTLQTYISNTLTKSSIHGWPPEGRKILVGSLTFFKIKLPFSIWFLELIY